jgi:hypothetical protein
MTKKSILGILVSVLLLAAVSLAQTIPGVATRVANGPTLPTNAGQYTMFVLTTGTPTLYICNNNPCMVSGDWVASGGGGGGGGGANTALSNLSGTAVNTGIYAATTVTMTLSGFQGTTSLAPTGVVIEGGSGYSTASQAGGSATLEGGNGGLGNGGAAYVKGGNAGTNFAGGAVTIAAGNGATGINGQGGILTLESGVAGSGAQPGYVYVIAPGSNQAASAIYLEPGTNTATSAPGTVVVYNGASIVFSGSGSGAGADGNIGGGQFSLDNPVNGWFSSNLYAGGNFTAVGTATITGNTTVGAALTANSVSTSGSGPWSVQGSYGTLSVSSAGKTRFGFGPNGPEFSFNGGALTYFATLDSAGVNVTQNADTLLGSLRHGGGSVRQRAVQHRDLPAVAHDHLPHGSLHLRDHLL